MAEHSVRNNRADLVAALVLVVAMLVAAWPPSAGLLLGAENLLAGIAGTSLDAPGRPAWGWPLEALLIMLLGGGIMYWGRTQPAMTTLALAGAVAMALLGLDVITRAMQLTSLHLVPPALTAMAAAGLCIALGGERSRGQVDPAQPPAPQTPPRARMSAPSPLVQARSALKAGRLEQAWQVLQAVPTTREGLETLYALGTEFQRAGQREEAASVFRRIEQQQADYRDVQARLQNMERGAARAGAPAGAASVRAQGRHRSTAAAGPGAAAARQDVPLPPAGAAGAERRPPVLRPVPKSGGGKPREPVKLGNGQTVTLGRYEVIRELGRGAMGVVYLGRDPRINRVVAIKAIPLAEEFEPEDLDEAKARFFREAETAGRLNHPNIVTIYDVGEEHELAYIAMEFLEGEHLSGNVKPETLLPMPVVVDAIARVADALAYAHRENVVHRDIKPANIMFDRNSDLLKITDFGIARLTDSSRTRTGIVLGTPSFMSPEQLEGKPVTGQSDLFSLGVTLYQLLTGQLPFRGSSMPKLMFAIANLAHAPVTHVRPELPEGLNQVMDMALAKNPAERFQTGAHMAQSLRAFLARLGT